MAMRRYRVNADLWTVLRDILDNREDFNTDSASLRGRNVSPRVARFDSTGRLDSPVFNGHRQAGSVDYIVYSYNTPIAYRTAFYNAATGSIDSQWYIPDVRYSVTTSKHQGKVRTALSVLSGYREDI